MNNFSSLQKNKFLVVKLVFQRELTQCLATGSPRESSGR